MATISGILPLRNGVKLGYPFQIAIRSLQQVCDEVIVSVDPTSEDDTLAQVKALGVDHVLESVWDMNNHQGRTNCEISRQTDILVKAATCKWVLSLQADEVLHENARLRIQEAISAWPQATGFNMYRIYFYGSLTQYRDNWSIWMVRLFQRGLWAADRDGAMRFWPVPGHTEEPTPLYDVPIFHYSRIGDPQLVAERVRNLDLFFHEPDKVGHVDKPYDFSQMRRLDTYVTDGPERDALDRAAALIPFPQEDHPLAVQEYFNV